MYYFTGPPSAAPKVMRQIIPGGDAGTRATLSKMRELADQGATDIAVRTSALEALRQYGARAHDRMAEAAAVFHFVKTRIRFTRDPVTAEWVQAPRRTLEFRSGDCDDMATLIAAMLQSVGIRASFRAVSVDPQRPSVFGHVYAIAHVDGRDISMDPIFSSNAFGYGPRGYRTMEVPA